METEHIEKFIKDAIEGGWTGYEKHIELGADPENVAYLIAPNLDMVAEILLDPEAWKAVGRQRGWGVSEHPYWPHQWHTFIDHLADGKTIDQALEALN